MRQIATLRVTQAATKVGEHAPMTAACCNACRTCVTTNVIGLATAALAGAGFVAAKLGRRLLGRASA